MQRVLAAIGCCVALVLFAGCGGGDDDASVAPGTTTVQGNVVAAQVTGRLMLKALALTDITVTVKGTGLSAGVDANGSFKIIGVSPGNHTLVFATANVSVEYPVALVGDSIVTLHNVTLLPNGSLTVERVAVDTLGADPLSTAELMAGTWTGTATLRLPGGGNDRLNLDEEYIYRPMTVTLSTSDGVSVSGTWSCIGKSGPISGTPVSGSVSFSLPNTDPGHIDCRNFNVRASVTLVGDSLVYVAAGNFCEDVGSETRLDSWGNTVTIIEYYGSYGTINATLTK